MIGSSASTSGTMWCAQYDNEIAVVDRVAPRTSFAFSSGRRNLGRRFEYSCHCRPNYRLAVSGSGGLTGSTAGVSIASVSGSIADFLFIQPLS